MDHFEDCESIEDMPSDVAGEDEEENGLKTAPDLVTPEQLREVLMPTLEKLYLHEPESLPFLQPVDPKVQRASNYFQVVKEPMDLSTIKQKLGSGQYTEPWQYISDIWLVFENAFRFNRKRSKVHTYSTKLFEIFKVDIEPVMKSLGYCCGQKHFFQPQTKYCYGKERCGIPRDGKYFLYKEYAICQTCFKRFKGDTVTITLEDEESAMIVRKKRFKEMKNNKIEREPFVKCKDCGRMLHQICVLHLDRIWPEGFICEKCLKLKNAKRKENKFKAQGLQSTHLGTFIETKVNRFLERKKSGAGKVYVRVVSSLEKVTEVQPRMKSRFVDSGELSETFPYRAKALFAFEEIDGAEVCFFGMHVQEYGSECPAPNTRRVYIAYLDSVHFFQPRELKTDVYHQILLGYLEYVKQLGYTAAHIWACPPAEGDDYIFNKHPADQKIPKPKRLQEWYRKLFDKAIDKGIIFGHNDILKQAMEDEVSSLTDLAYFEGDFWPTRFEEILRDIEEDRWKPKPKKAKKAQSKKSRPPTRDLYDRGLREIEKNKDAFIVATLHPNEDISSLPPIEDPDPDITCDFMDGRDAFLSLSQKMRYEFVDLRRTKYSSLAMLYNLHNPGEYDESVLCTCNNCERQIEVGLQCTLCEDFDLCTECFQKIGHQHKMDEFGNSWDTTPKDQNEEQMTPEDIKEEQTPPKDVKEEQTSPKERNRDEKPPKERIQVEKPLKERIQVEKPLKERIQVETPLKERIQVETPLKERIQVEKPLKKRIQDEKSLEKRNVDEKQRLKEMIFMSHQCLLHACVCKSSDCKNIKCVKMKELISHTNVCTDFITTGKDCSIAKQLIGLSCLHAEICKEGICPVPFCARAKHEMRIREAQKRLPMVILVYRRLQQLMERTYGGTNPSSVVSTIAAQYRASAERMLSDMPVDEMLQAWKTPAWPQDNNFENVFTNPAVANKYEPDDPNSPISVYRAMKDDMANNGWSQHQNIFLMIMDSKES